METRAQYIAVGAFVLIILVAGVASVLWLGRVEFGRELDTYYIFFRGSVAGLTRGSAVQYNGIPVGRVTDIRVDRENLSQIRVTVQIDSNLVEIKTDARAFLDTNILSGVATVQIRGGTQQASILEPKQGHHYAIIKAGQSALEEVKSSLPDLVADLKLASHNLNLLLDERNRRAVADSLQNLRTITAALADHSQDVGVILDHTDASILEMKSLIHNIDHSYTMRGGLKDQVVQTLKDYDRVATNLSDTARQLQAMVSENRPGLRDFVQTTLPGVDDLVNDGQRLAENLNQFVIQLQRDPTRLLFGDRRRGYQPQ
jgi:phospholipid/cholesterol/gamma-HCH transport system substrate-binding protein